MIRGADLMECLDLGFIAFFFFCYILLLVEFGRKFYVLSGYINTYVNNG